jgi:PHD/YefM family antitoxin component YafN of YafNO toxin-antitoxin module
METFTAQDMQNNARVLRESAMSEPVIIMSDDRPSLVLMSMQQYDRLRGRRRIVGSASELSSGLVESLDAFLEPDGNDAVTNDQPADGPRP